MKEGYNQSHKWVANLVYFAVLGATFYISCAILAVQRQESLSLQTLIYASVIFVSIKVGRYGVAIITRSQSRIIYTVLVNAAGITIGVVMLLLLRLFVPELTVSVIALIVSSIIAFFVLGTISPFLLSDRRVSAR